MFKKITAVICIIAMLCSFVGCSGTTNGGSGKHQSNVINIGIRKAGYSTAWIETMAKKYMEQHEGIKVNIEATTGMAGTAARAFNQNKTSQYKDLYFVHCLTSDWMLWQATGKLYPMKSEKITGALDKELLALGSIDNTLYYLSPFMPLIGFAYNQDYIDKIPSLGQFTQGTFPTTMQGMYDMMASLEKNPIFYKDTSGNSKKVLPFSYGGATDEPNLVFMSLFAQGNGGKDFEAYFGQDGSASSPNKAAYVNDSLVNAMTALSKMMKPSGGSSSISVNGSASFTNIDSEKAFLTGACVFCNTGSWFESETTELRKSESAVKNYRFAAVPNINAADKQLTAIANVPTDGYFIPKNSNNPEGALDFLEFMAEESNAKEITKMITTPTAYNYTYSDADMADYSTFAKDVVRIYADSRIAIPYADTLLCRAGVLQGVVLTSGGACEYVWRKLSLGDYTTETEFRSVLEKSYAGARSNWKDWQETAGIGW